MTPTEQDKELRSLISDVMADLMVDVSLNKLLKNDGDILEKGRQYMESHNNRLNIIMQLITADRKRVALEARRNEALIADRNLGQYPDYHKMKTASLKRIDDIERGLFISVHDLKAQQEDKDD